MGLCAPRSGRGTPYYHPIRQGAYSGSGSSNPALFAAICLRGVPTPRAPEKTTPRGDGKYISPPGGEENLFVFSLLIQVDLYCLFMWLLSVMQVFACLCMSSYTLPYASEELGSDKEVVLTRMHAVACHGQRVQLTRAG